MASDQLLMVLSKKPLNVKMNQKAHPQYQPPVTVWYPLGSPNTAHGEADSSWALWATHMNSEHSIAESAIGVVISQHHIKWEKLGNASAAHRKEAYPHRQLSHQRLGVWWDTADRTSCPAVTLAPT